MIGYDQMIGALPADIRGVLRGRHDDPAVRHIARMVHETRGDPVPQQCMDEAIEAWIALGAPEPDPVPPGCVLCEHELEGGEDPADPWRCGGCDITYGPSWVTDPERAAQLTAWRTPTVPGM